MTKSSQPTKTQLTTFKDGARQLSCAAGTFSIHIENGELDVVKVGIRGRRVIQAQLEALIAKNTLRAIRSDKVRAALSMRCADANEATRCIPSRDVGNFSDQTARESSPQIKRRTGPADGDTTCTD